MGVLGGTAGRERRLRWPPALRRSPQAARAESFLSPAEWAWIAAIPTALIAAAAIVLLGPVLGDVLFAPTDARFWSGFSNQVNPEPAELGGYVAALCVPLVFAALVGAGSGLRVPATRARRGLLVPAAQLAFLAFIVWCFVAQRTPPIAVLGEPELVFVSYFPQPALLAAAIGTLAIVLVVRSAQARALMRNLARETRGRATLAGLVAVALITLWLLHAVYTERTIGASYPEVLYHVQFTADETYAVLDGGSPLVDYVAQYGSLWPYLFAAVMAVVGDSLGVWFVLAVTTTGLGMLAIYAVLRRVAGSSLCGLLLFLPVLAASFHQMAGTFDNRYTFANYYGTFPLRYAGPSILAWLVARQLGGDAPRRAWLLFAAASLVVFNNADAGIPAFGATVAAVVWGGRVPITRYGIARLALAIGAGFGTAFALTSVLTLVRAGALPNLEFLVRFSRLFASAGFGMHPLFAIGLYLVVFVTFVAALGAATVLRFQASSDRTLTGMLAWGGVFGFGAGAYYVGRSTPEDLFALFFPWAFVLALLVVPALRSISRFSWRPAPVAPITAVFGLLLMAASLAQTPTPWGQLERLSEDGPASFAAPTGQSFVADHTRPGEPVAVLAIFGHRIAANLDVANVSPYANVLSMPTVEHFEEMLRALREAGGHKVFMQPKYTTDEMQVLLTNAGFHFVTEDARGETTLWAEDGESGEDG